MSDELKDYPEVWQPDGVDIELVARSDYDALRAELEAALAEKERRIYYQDIVYECCRLLDGGVRSGGEVIVCGTKDNPSTELQERIQEMVRQKLQQANENARLRAALERAIQGYNNLIEVGALPHEGWDRDTEKYIAEMQAALSGEEE